jgi:hypothetical protein
MRGWLLLSHGATKEQMAGYLQLDTDDNHSHTHLQQKIAGFRKSLADRGSVNIAPVAPGQRQ